ncbi:MAG: phosphoribosylanthranilate isomerase [Rhodospirillales bacterium]|nr:phosphoribosylanthranilate isomerase [Rhodospirillales bacterium]
MTVSVKICGLSDEAAVAAAVDGGADMVGFVFFQASPRYVAPMRAGALAEAVPQGIVRVGLVVDASDELLAEIVLKAGIDMLQLHGAETPERVREIKERFGLPVMKVLPIADAEDVAKASDYEGIADKLMFDAKPLKGATRPGGNARAFDWALLKGAAVEVPWVLAGGLTAENVAQAVKASGAQALDVSSGVEDAPGRKSPEKIAEFLKAAKAL